MKVEGNALSEVGLPVTGGSTSCRMGDFNGDGKPDLLLATFAGPKLLTNQGTAFKDDSALLPKEAYYNVTAAAWLDYDGDKRPDILIANGFLGLRLYRNLGEPKDGKQFEDVSRGCQAMAPAGCRGGSERGDYLATADINGDGRRMDFLYCAGTGLVALNTPHLVCCNRRPCGLKFATGKVRRLFCGLQRRSETGLVCAPEWNIKIIRQSGRSL